MKTLCLGGSFNPIHHGHLICARAVAEAAGFERVMLIPSARPPHKPVQSDLADAAHRLEMCRLAIQSQGQNKGDSGSVLFEVSDLEITRPGPSYTIDTVRELRRQGWPEVNWLIGADMLNILPKWHEYAALVTEANFIVMARPGTTIDWNTLPAGFGKLKGNVVAAPLIEISSSEIRRRVPEGKGIEFLTAQAVVDYVNRNGLYQR